MESKHKNALIGALLAVVFVMAVGYAAFAQQLTINGTAEITSNWDVHFNPSYTGTDPVSGTTPVNITTGTLSGGATSSIAPTGSITYSSENQTADIEANLVQPGDSITFTLKPHNYGTGLNATGTMTVSDYAGSKTAQTGQTWTGVSYDPSNHAGVTVPVTVTKGYIKFVITPTFANPLTPGSEDTITVVASYEQPQTNATDTVQNSAGITITLNYVQV